MRGLLCSIVVSLESFDPSHSSGRANIEEIVVLLLDPAREQSVPCPLDKTVNAPAHGLHSTGWGEKASDPL